MSLSSILLAPFNWRRGARKNPTGFFAEAQFQGREMIAEQEISGRQSFIESNTLPTRIYDGFYEGSRDALEAAGVKFLDVVADDPQFQFVELPIGWKKVAVTDNMNPYWTNLVDESGTVRAEIFFKAAFHAREVWMRIS